MSAASTAAKWLGYRLRLANNQLASKPDDDWMALADALREPDPELQRGNVLVMPLMLCEECQEMRPHVETAKGESATCRVCGLRREFAEWPEFP